MSYIVRCQMRCPHGDQCVNEAGHESKPFHPDEPDSPMIGCSHRDCGCNEANHHVRPDWDHYFMAIARATSLRSNCDRKLVGAVLVADKRIIATGYNGAPSGLPTCMEAGHQLVDMNGRKSCVRTIHAEHNAIIQCSLVGVPCAGSVLYTTASPCLECTKAIITSGVSAVVYAELYVSARTGGLDMAKLAAANGISWRHLP